jgi:hypothetical protein
MSGIVVYDSWSPTMGWCWAAGQQLCTAPASLYYLCHGVCHALLHLTCNQADKLEGIVLAARIRCI